MKNATANAHKLLVVLLAGATVAATGCTVDATGSSEAASTESQPMSFVELYDAYNGVELPGCGTFSLCWYDSTTKQCAHWPSEMPTDVLDLRVMADDPRKRIWLAMNVEANLKKGVGPDGSETVTYWESYPKSMPPGPGASAGYQSRYTLTMHSVEGQVVDFEIYQEDFDPMTKTWGPWFDIRYNLDNPIVCQREGQVEE